MKKAKNKKFLSNQAKIKLVTELKKEIGKHTYQHKFSHYCFECELHPDDNREELEKQFRELHV